MAQVVSATLISLILVMLGGVLGSYAMAIRVRDGRPLPYQGVAKDGLEKRGGLAWLFAIVLIVLSVFV